MSTGIAFKLDREGFAEHFEKAYARVGIKPKRLLQFASVLPFEFPVPDHTILTITLNSESAVTLITTDLNRNEIADGGQLGPDPEQVEVIRTHIEFNFVTVETVDWTNGQVVSESIDKCIDALNYVLGAYCMLFHDASVTRISKEMLEFAVITRCICIPEWSSEDFLVTLHIQPPMKKTKLDQSQIGILLKRASHFRDKANPFLFVQEHFMAANRSLIQGYYEWSVISATVAVESLVRTIAHLASSEYGMPVSSGKRLVPLEEVPFYSILTSFLPYYFGGRWDASDESTLCNKWYRNCYLLRNRVLHGALRPTVAEADGAVEVSWKLRAYIFDLLDKKRKKYEFVRSYLALKPKASS